MTDSTNLQPSSTLITWCPLKTKRSHHNAVTDDVRDIYMEQWNAMDKEGICSACKTAAGLSTLASAPLKHHHCCLVIQSGRSRSRGREEGGESPDSSSLGSSSHANDSMDSGSETRRSSPNLPPSPSHDGEAGDQRTLKDSQTPNNHRKSLPPTISDMFASQVLR